MDDAVLPFKYGVVPQADLIMQVATVAMCLLIFSAKL